MSGNWVSYIKRHGKPAMGSWHEDGVLKVKGRLAKLDLESPPKLREGENQVDPEGHFWRVWGPMEPGPPARRLIRR